MNFKPIRAEDVPFKSCPTQTFLIGSMPYSKIRFNNLVIEGEYKLSNLVFHLKDGSIHTIQDNTLVTPVTLEIVEVSE